MTRNDTVQAICEAYRQFVPPGAAALEVNETTPLFGADSQLDSVGLVSLIVEVEQNINDRCDSAITIADERAMSQTRSPFRTIGSLADYVHTLLNPAAGV